MPSENPSQWDIPRKVVKIIDSLLVTTGLIVLTGGAGTIPQQKGPPKTNPTKMVELPKTYLEQYQEIVGEDLTDQEKGDQIAEKAFSSLK